MEPLRFATAIGVCLALAVAAASEVPARLPEPGEAGSHERYVEALRREEARVAAELLARYERRLAEAPDDVVAAIERCRFLGAAFYDPETEENPREEERSACLEDIDARFGTHPDARVFAIEERWSDEAVEAGERFLADPPAKSEPRHLAAVHAHLANQLQYDDLQQARDHAEQAMELDPSLDLRLLVARARVEAGDDAGARSVLVARLAETKESWHLESKAVLLADLEAYEAALAAFAEIERRGEDPQKSFDHARALAGAGRVEDARAMYAASGSEWVTDEALQSRFEFELEHGSLESARAAYDALAERSWELDLFGRQRLALLVAHPLAPWKMADAVGLLVLGSIAFSIVLLPGFVVLPVYAWGQLRRRRGSPAAEPGAPFGLRHAWMAVAVLLLAEVAGFLVYPDALEEVGIGHQTASYALFSAVAAIVGLLIVVRRKLAALVGRGRWGAVRTVVGAILVMASFQLVAVAVAYVTGDEAGDESTVEMIRSVRRSFGVPATFVLAAMLIPISEEIVFRGVLLSAFRTRLSPGRANFTQACLFGLMHIHPVVTPAAFVLGLGAGRLTRASGTLRPALLAHMITNAIACASIVATTGAA